VAGYSVLFRKSVRRDLSPVPEKDVLEPCIANDRGRSPVPRRKRLDSRIDYAKINNRIMDRIQSLADDPRPPGCEKLSAQERYRVRQGDYRIVYSIQDDDRTVWIVKV